MYFGFAISVLIHAGLLAWALVNISSTPPFTMPGPEPVEVAVITEEDLVRLKKGSRQSKLLESQKADSTEGKADKPTKKPKVAPPPPPAETAPPPPPEPAKAEPPPEPPAKSDPIGEQIAALAKPVETKPPPPKKDDAAELAMLQKKKEAEDKAKAEAEAEAKQKAAAEAEKKMQEEAQRKAEAEKKRKAEEARKKAEAERKKRLERQKKLVAEKRKADEKRRKKKAESKLSFDERMDAELAKALADKDPTRKNTRGGSEEDPKQATKNRGATAGAPEGTDDRLTASQRAMLGLMMKTKTKPCWRINAGAEGIQTIVIKLDVRLKRDGTLASAPQIVSRGSGQLYRDAADAAVRAVVGCAPYDLPANLYESGWDYMRVTFDPRSMY